MNMLHDDQTTQAPAPATDDAATGDSQNEETPATEGSDSNA